LEVDRAFVTLPIVWDYMDIDGKDVRGNMKVASRGIDSWKRRILWRG